MKDEENITFERTTIEAASRNSKHPFLKQNK
jgi:hypothetical protein